MVVVVLVLVVMASAYVAYLVENVVGHPRYDSDGVHTQQHCKNRDGLEELLD